MQADVILKEPLPWITPPLNGGTRMGIKFPNVQYAHDTWYKIIDHFPKKKHILYFYIPNK